MAEQLEKTEQSISLVLQEIDRNFAQANRIVSQQILPEIHKYAKGSRNLWTNVGFWKSFLEDSASVNLAMFEEELTQLSFETNASAKPYSAMTPVAGIDNNNNNRPTDLSSPLQRDPKLQSHHPDSTRKQQHTLQLTSVQDQLPSEFGSAMSTAPLLTTNVGHDSKQQSTLGYRGSIFSSSTSMYPPVRSDTLHLMERIAESSPNMRRQADPRESMPYNDNLARLFDHRQQNIPGTVTKSVKRDRTEFLSSPIRRTVGNKAWRIRATPSPKKRKKSIYEVCMEDTDDAIVPPKLESEFAISHKLVDKDDDQSIPIQNVELEDNQTQLAPFDNNAGPSNINQTEPNVPLAAPQDSPRVDSPREGSQQANYDNDTPSKSKSQA